MMAPVAVAVWALRMVATLVAVGFSATSGSLADAPPLASAASKATCPRQRSIRSSVPDNSGASSVPVSTAPKLREVSESRRSASRGSSAPTTANSGSETASSSRA